MGYPGSTGRDDQEEPRCQDEPGVSKKLKTESGFRLLSPAPFFLLGFLECIGLIRVLGHLQFGRKTN